MDILDIAMEQKIWIENTKSNFDHGGIGWEFGRCLWAPGPGAYGNSRYEFLQEVQVGDQVVHCYDRVFRGQSKVALPAKIVKTEPPKAGPWSSRGEYYRIELEDYKEFQKCLSLADFVSRYEAEIRDDLV